MRLQEAADRPIRLERHPYSSPLRKAYCHGAVTVTVVGTTTVVVSVSALVSVPAVRVTVLATVFPFVSVNAHPRLSVRIYAQSPQRLLFIKYDRRCARVIVCVTGFANTVAVDCRYVVQVLVTSFVNSSVNAYFVVVVHVGTGGVPVVVVAANATPL